jgi:hypothetical protein
VSCQSHLKPGFKNSDTVRLILLSQKVAGFIQKKHVFGEAHFFAS